MINNKKIILAVLAVVIVGTIIYLESQKPERITSSDAEIFTSRVDIQEKVKRYDRAKEIVNPSGFINTDGEEIRIADLIGKKVILVDFWTYSCINCQRTQPYLNSWYDKYRDEGLEIIGMHTPEFEFEKDYDNVVAATQKFEIKYPVVQDNDYSTWTAYKNRYWPRKYLIDIDGFIVYDHIGEGAYDETEKKIQELLSERAEVLGKEAMVEQEITEFGTSDTVGLALSPETYFGALRNENFGSGARGTVGAGNFTAPATVVFNTLYLSGNWDITEEFAENKQAGGAIIYNYKATNVFFVASSNVGVRAKILRDGKPLGEEAGEDVEFIDGQSYVQIKEPRLYRLIEDGSGYGKHLLEIIIESPGLQGFAFTFG